MRRFVVCAALAAACGGDSNPCRPLTADGRLSCPNPHPPGWANAVGLGPERFHGDAATAADSCGRCHDRGDAELCTACHRVGGIGGNVHPPSFLAAHRLGDVQTGAAVTIPGGVSMHCTACHAR